MAIHSKRLGGTELGNEEPVPGESDRLGKNGRRAVGWFIVAVLAVGVPVSIIFVVSDSDEGMDRLLAVGASLLVAGTVIQMALSWVDPVGMRETKSVKERFKTLKSEKAVAVEVSVEEVDEAVGKAIGSGALVILKHPEAPELGHTRRQRMQMKVMLRRLRKCWRKSFVDAVNKKQTDEINDLKSTNFRLSRGSWAWSCLAIGSIMLAVGAWGDLLANDPSSNSDRCVVTVESSSTPPTTFSCDVTIKVESNQPSQ